MPSISDGQWIGVMKVGEYHWDPWGKKHRSIITQEDVDAMAADYNPIQMQAPATIGHPSFWGDSDETAHGWVETLKVRGSTLYAKFKELSQELRDGIEQGKYKARSIGMMPAKYSETKRAVLRHVAFLGSSNPAVPGLMPTFDDNTVPPTPTFSDNMEIQPLTDDELSELSDDIDPQRIEIHNHSLRIGGESMGEVDVTALQTQVDALTKQVTELAERPDITPERVKELEDNESKFKALQTKHADVESKLSDERKNRIKTEVSGFCGDLVKQGRMTPAMQKAGAEILLTELASAENGDGTAKFAVDDKQLTAYQILKNIFAALPQQVNFEEVVPEDPDATNLEHAGVPKNVDAGSAKVQLRAEQIQAKNPDMSLEEAQDQAYKELNHGR